MPVALDERAAAAGGTAPPARSPFLEIRSVGKQFGTFVALKDVSLSIAEGEFVSFVGPSGCGKTTLLRAIAGLDPATTGVIRQAGREITGLPPAERDFGIVFQSYALFPNLTVARNVAHGLRGPAWARPRIDARVDELIRLVGLAEHATKYPAQLSGGQQQRVALARALAPEPEAVVDATPGMLRAHGHALPAEAARGMLYGTQVHAFVRPEEVRLGAAALAMPGAIWMEVVHLEFLGATCRVALEAGRLRLEADAIAEQLRKAGALPGAKVPVAVPAAAVMLFPADV